MWQLFLVLVLGLAVVWTGWRIGRLFAGNSTDPERDALRVVWLVEDIVPGELNRFRVGFENFRLRRHLRQAAKAIQNNLVMSETPIDLDIEVRSIGRWTFAGKSSLNNPGRAFLQPNEMIIHPERLRDKNVNSNGIRIELYSSSIHPTSIASNEYLLGSQSDTAAFLAAHHASQNPRLKFEFLEVSAALLNTPNQTHFDLQTGLTDGDTFDCSYLRAWVMGELGIERLEKNGLENALQIYRRQWRHANSAPRDMDCPIHVGLAPHAARIALYSYLADNRHPERLLEADDFCGQALEHLPHLKGAPLRARISILRAQIGRLLALHDQSLQRIDDAARILADVEASRGSSGRGADFFGLLLETARNHAARYQISQRRRDLRRALEAYNRTLAAFAGETDVLASDVAEVQFERSQLLFELADRDDDDHSLSRLVRKLAGMQKTLDGIISRGSPRLKYLRARCALFEARVNGVLATRRQDEATVRRFLSAMDSIPALSPDLWCTESFEFEREIVRAELLLGLAECTALPTDYMACLRASRTPSLRGINKSGFTHPPQIDRIKNLLLSAIKGTASKMDQIEEPVDFAGIVDDCTYLKSLVSMSKNPRQMAEVKTLQGDLVYARSKNSRNGVALLLKAAIRSYRRALELTPRGEVPASWCRLQMKLGQALEELAEAMGDLSALEASIGAFEKSLDVTESALSIKDKMERLERLADVVATFSEDGHDRSRLARARATLLSCYDLASASSLEQNARRADAALSRLRNGAHRDV